MCAENKVHFKVITSLVFLASSSSLEKTVKLWDFNLKPIRIIDQFYSWIKSILLLKNIILDSGCLGDVILFSLTENHDQQRQIFKSSYKTS